MRRVLSQLHQQKGYTLIEVLLVLAIFAMILVISLRQYYFVSTQTQVDQLQVNIDQLFQSMSAYYKANCANSSATVAVPLNPTAGVSITDPAVIDNTNALDALVTPGFLAQWPPPPNALVDNSTNEGYILQFNLTSNTPRTTVNFRGVAATGLSLGTVYFWNLQVAVKLQNPTLRNVYQARLGADCISDLNGNSIIPCSSTSPAPPITTGTYLVWSRLPSFSQPNTISRLWPSLPLLQQFNQLYTNDTFYEMNNPNQAANAYYLCGG